MVQMTQLQNMDYSFEAYATQAFNAPDRRALAVSWLGLPDILPIWPFWPPRNLLFGQGTHNQRRQALPVSSRLLGPSCFWRSLLKQFPNQEYLRTWNQLRSYNSQSKIVLLADKEVRKFQSTLTLQTVKWHWIVEDLRTVCPRIWDNSFLTYPESGYYCYNLHR